MNCLRLYISRVGSPLSVKSTRVPKAMSVSAVCVSPHLSVSVGLVCSVGDSSIKLISSDIFLLRSSDGYILCGQQIQEP